MIIEASPPDYHVDPSQGSHFFQNITSLRIGYLTVPPGLSEARLELGWLDAQAAQEETAFLRHVRLREALDIRLDGRAGRAVIYKRTPALAEEP